jgi:hypothetical protein
MSSRESVSLSSDPESDFVKQRLPDVEARFVEQGDGNFPAPS